MRYLYYVIALVVISLMFLGYSLMPKRPEDKDVVARINNRVITKTEFEDSLARAEAMTHVKKDRRSFLQDMISKELLIQEAEKMGLDKDESFRRSIQNYYEQTLLKNLINRKMDMIKVSVTDKEIEDYYNNMDKPRPPFSEVKDKIRAALEEKNKQQALEAWFNNLKEKASIKINEALVR